jgi:hypothetical protein
MEEALTRRASRVEAVSTVLLAAAAIATAWAGYQSTRWSGDQAQEYSQASALRVESTRASSLAQSQTVIDVSTFTQWVNAYASGNANLADFYLRRFRPEFKPAVDAWIATRPLTNTSAPLTPFAMPQYHLAAAAQAAGLERQASAASARAQISNQRGDNYVLAVVMFAVALFFAGISSRLRSEQHREVIVALGVIVFVLTVVWLATFPVDVGV